MTDDKLQICAFKKFDEENGKDPNKEEFQGKSFPKELLYAYRMSEWLARLAPQASESLQLAVRSQHICRWTIPRDSYPMNRKGYLQWRSELKQFHADKASSIMQMCGYQSNTIDRVKSLIRKKGIKTDPEAQTLEDVVCLVFLQYYFEEFALKHDSEKVISIIRKTWNKMSENGQQHALSIAHSETASNLITQAIE